jgi:hypothetical protein
MVLFNDTLTFLTLRLLPAAVYLKPASTPDEAATNKLFREFEKAAVGVIFPDTKPSPLSYEDENTSEPTTAAKP